MTHISSIILKDGSVTVQFMNDRDIECEINCANEYVARSVRAVGECNYPDAERTAFIMNEFYKAGNKYCLD